MLLLFKDSCCRFKSYSGRKMPEKPWQQTWTILTHLLFLPVQNGWDGVGWVGAGMQWTCCIDTQRNTWARESEHWMHVLPPPTPGGRSVNARCTLCVCPLLFHLYMSVLLFVSSYIVFWNNAVHFFTSLLFSSSSYVSLCLQKWN